MCFFLFHSEGHIGLERKVTKLEAMVKMLQEDLKKVGGENANVCTFFIFYFFCGLKPPSCVVLNDASTSRDENWKALHTAEQGADVNKYFVLNRKDTAVECRHCCFGSALLLFVNCWLRFHRNHSNYIHYHCSQAKGSKTTFRDAFLALDTSVRVCSIFTHLSWSKPAVQCQTILADFFENTLKLQISWSPTPKSLLYTRISEKSKRLWLKVRNKVWLARDVQLVLPCYMCAKKTFPTPLSYRL